MHPPQIDHNSSLVVILGASAWPKCPEFESSSAFEKSASLIRDYFRLYLKVSDHAILNLFDTHLSPDDSDTRIGEFLASTSLGKSNLFLYFVGHGGFAGSDKEFVLATRSAREDNLSVSCISIRALAHTLRAKASNLRCYLILDCCYSAFAIRHFLARPKDHISFELKEAFATPIPGRGTALLCSSSSTKTSHMLADGSGTAFTDALIFLLTGGVYTNAPLFSLSDLLAPLIDRLGRSGYPRPELHCPGQPEGDITRVKIFPNPHTYNTLDSSRTLNTNCGTLPQLETTRQNKIVYIAIASVILCACGAAALLVKRSRYRDIAPAVQLTSTDFPSSSPTPLSGSTLPPSPLSLPGSTLSPPQSTIAPQPTDNPTPSPIRHPSAHQVSDPARFSTPPGRSTPSLLTLLDRAKPWLNDALKEASSDEGPSDWYLQEIAIARARTDDFAGAEELANLVKSDNYKREAFIGIAKALARAGNIADAKRLATKVPEDDRDGVTFALMQRQIQMNDLAGAKSSAAGLSGRRVNIIGLCIIAQAEFRMGDSMASRKTFARAANLSTSRKDSSFEYDYLILIAVAQGRIGDNVSSRATFVQARNKANSIKYDYKFSFLSDIAIAQTWTGDTAGASVTVDLIKTPSEKLEVLRRIAVAQASSGDKEASNRTLERVRNIVHSDRGTDNTEKAVELWRLAKAKAEAGDVTGAIATANSISIPADKDGALGDIAAAQAKAGDVVGAGLTANSLSGYDSKATALRAIVQAQAKNGDMTNAISTVNDAVTKVGQTKKANHRMLKISLDLAIADGLLEGDGRLLYDTDHSYTEWF